MNSFLDATGFRRPAGFWRDLSRVVLGWAVALVVLSACGPVDPATRHPGLPEPGEISTPSVDDRGGPPGQTPENSLPGQREDRLAPAVPTQLERVIPPDETPVTGEVPVELLEAVLTDLQGRLQVERVEITILRAEQVLWPDGSLGCPQPGQNYTQAQVEGYRVILQAGSSEYDYRLTRNGFIMLCEGPLLPR